MPLETLDFEEPIAVLLKEIDALTRAAAHRGARSRRSSRCSAGSRRFARDLYRSLTPWQRVLVARHPNRPGLEDFIQRLFTNFVEIHGDRRFADDHAIMTGFADYKGAAGAARRPRQGRRHQGQDLPELRLRAPRGLPQGAPRDAARREVQPADHRVRRHAGRVSRASSRRNAAWPKRSRSTCGT